MLFVCVKTLFVFSLCHLVYSCDMEVLIKPDWYLYLTVIYYYTYKACPYQKTIGMDKHYDKGTLETCWKKVKQNSCI